MNAKPATRLKTALEEVSAFFRGEGPPMLFHMPDGKGGSSERILSLNEYIQATAIDRKNQSD